MARNSNLGKDGDKALDLYRRKELGNMARYKAEVYIIRQTLINENYLKPTKQDYALGIANEQEK